MCETVFLFADFTLYYKISLKFALAIDYISSNLKFLTLRSMQLQLNVYAPIFTANAQVRGV